MTSVRIDVGTHERLEFAFGALAKGPEAGSLAEYWPAATPLFQEHGLQQLPSFGVIATNRPGAAPEMGAFCSWPTAEHRVRLQADQRFIAILPIRDKAMDFLADGYLFEPPRAALELDTDADYAIVIAKDAMLEGAPILELPATADTAAHEYAGRTLSLHPWSDAAQALLDAAPAAVDVFRVRFNPPG